MKRIGQFIVVWLGALVSLAVLGLVMRVIDIWLRQISPQVCVVGISTVLVIVVGIIAWEFTK